MNLLSTDQFSGLKESRLLGFSPEGGGAFEVPKTPDQMHKESEVSEGNAKERRSTKQAARERRKVRQQRKETEEQDRKRESRRLVELEASLAASSERATNEDFDKRRAEGAEATTRVLEHIKAQLALEKQNASIEQDGNRIRVKSGGDKVTFFIQKTDRVENPYVINAQHDREGSIRQFPDLPAAKDIEGVAASISSYLGSKLEISLQSGATEFEAGRAGSGNVLEEALAQLMASGVEKRGVSLEYNKQYAHELHVKYGKDRVSFYVQKTKRVEAPYHIGVVHDKDGGVAKGGSREMPDLPPAKDAGEVAKTIGNYLTNELIGRK